MRKFSPIESLQNKLGDISRRTNAADFLFSNIIKKKLNGGVSIQKVILVSFVLTAALVCGFLYNKQTEHAQAIDSTCFWKGTVSTDWGNKANWLCSAGDKIPGVVDHVYFDDNSNAGYQPIIGSDVSVEQLQLGDTMRTYTGTVTVGAGVSIAISTHFLIYSGTFIAPDNGTISVGGNYVLNDGSTFTARTSTFLFNNGVVGTSYIAGDTTFYNLTFSSPSIARTWKFSTHVVVDNIDPLKNMYTIKVTNNFVANGSANNLIRFDSYTVVDEEFPSATYTKWGIDLTGATTSMSYLQVRHSVSLKTGYLNPSNSVNLGYTYGWFEPITITGKCNNVNDKVQVGIDGVLAYEMYPDQYEYKDRILTATTATDVNGQCNYTMANVTKPKVGDSIIAFVSAVGAIAPTDAQKATSAMKYQNSGNVIPGNITGLDLRLKTLSIGADDSQPVNSADLNKYDYDQNSNILYSIDAGLNLAKSPGYIPTFEIYVRGGSAFAPTLNNAGYNSKSITADTLEIATGATLLGGYATIDLKATGTPFTKTGTFTPESSTFKYSAAPIVATAADYYNLETLGTGGNTTLAAGTFNVGNNFIVGNGTAITNVLTSTNNPTLNLMNFEIKINSIFLASATATMNVGGDFTSSGLFTHNNGTLTLTADKIVAFVKITNAGTKFYNLSVSKINPIDGNIEIYNNILVEKDLVFKNVVNDKYISFRKDYQTSSAIVTVAGNVSFPSTPSNTGKVHLGYYDGADETYTPTIDFKGSFDMAEGNIDYQTPSVRLRANFIASGAVDQRFSRLRETSAYLVSVGASQPSYLAGNFTKSTWKFNLASGRSVIPDSDFIFDNVTCDATHSANFARNGNYKTVLDGLAYNTGCDTKFVQPVEPVSPEPAYDKTGYLWFGDFTMNAINKTFTINSTFKTQFGFARSKFDYVAGQTLETWINGVTTINNGTLAFPDNYLVSIGSIALNTGNINAPSSAGVMTLYGDFTRLSTATFNAGTGQTIANLRYANINITANGGQAFYNFNVLNTSLIDAYGANRVLTFNDNLTINNDLTIENTIPSQYCGYYNGSQQGTATLYSSNALATVTVNGNIKYPHTVNSTCTTAIGSSDANRNFTFDLKGDILLEDDNNQNGQSSTSDSFYANVNFIGNKDQFVSKTDVLKPELGQWKINKDDSLNLVKLSSSFVSSSSSPISFTVDKGTFDLNGKNFEVWGSTNINDLATLRLLGTEATPQTISFSKLSTTEYYGLPSGLEIKNYNYGNLTINSTDGTNTGTYALPSFLAGYWKMDENSWSGSGAVKDSTGLGRDATAAGATTPSTDGKYNNAASFTRTATDTTSSYINAGTMSGVDLTGEVTISTWVKFNAAPSCHSAQGFVSKGDGLKLYSGCGILSDARYFAFEAAGAIASFPIEPVVGTWYHLAGVYKQYESVKLYVDGALKGTNSTLNAKRTENADFLKIGGGYSEKIDCVAAGNSSCVVSNYVETFDGKMDEVRLYNKALTDAQVTDLYANNENTAQYKTNVQNNVLIKGGTLDGQGRSIGVGGSWTNQATFLSKDGNITFNSTDADVKLINNNNQDFGNLTFDSGISNTGQWKFVDTAINLQNSLYINQTNTSSLGVNLDNKATTVAGNVTLVGGKLTAGSAILNVAGDWINTGGSSVFAYGTSTVNLNKSVDTQQISGDTIFYNLVKQVATEQHLVFAANSHTRVMGVWTAKGTTAGALFIESSTKGSQWFISLSNVATGKDLNYLVVQDSHNESGTDIDVRTLQVYDLGNNVHWLFGAKSISGTCYGYDEVSTNFCAPATGVVKMALNGTPQPLFGNITDFGKWSIQGYVAQAGDVITVYLDGLEPGRRANLVAVFNGGDIVNAQLFENHLTLGESNSLPVTNKLASAYDYTVANDPDIIFDVDTANNYQMTMNNSGLIIHNEILYVADRGTYQPKDSSNTVISTISPNIHIGPLGKLDLNNCITTDACTVTVNGGDWVNSLTGNFSSGISTVNFSGNATSRIIKTGNEASKFYKSVINGNVTSSADWAPSDGTGNPYQYQKAITVAGPYNGTGNPGDSLKSGLTSEYKMNEASLTPTGNVIDSGTKNLPATNSNATISAGKFGNAATFDATNNSYIAMPVAATSTLGKNFTVSMWVNTLQSTTGTYDPTLFGVKTNSALYPYLNVSVRNGVLGMTNNMGGGTQSTFTTPSLAKSYNIADGLWHHVVVVADGTKISLYANKGDDGNLKYLGYNPISNGLINDASLYLGAVNFPISAPPTSCFTGKLDDVRIYNRALSSTELALLDQSNEESYFDVAKVSTYQTVLDDAEALRYTFEGVDLGADASGNSNTAVVSGPTKVAGKFDIGTNTATGNALKFANVGDYVNIPNKIIPGPGSEFAVSMWFYQELAGTAPQIFMGESNATGGFYFGTANGGASPNYDDIQFGGWTNDVGAWSVGPGQWHHVVGVSRKDGADIYFDGTKYSRSTPLTYTNNPDSFVLGKKNAALADGQFKGGLDEVRVYKRLLTDADVASLQTNNITSDWADIYAKAEADGKDIIFADSDKVTSLDFYRDKFTATGQNARYAVKVPNLPVGGTKTIYMYYGNVHNDKSNPASAFESSNNANLRAAWSLDENQGTSAYDTTANANTCAFGSTRGDAIYWSSLGKFNSSFNAWNFPGSGAQSYMDCGNKSAISSISGAITLEAWVKTNSAGNQNGDIISKTFNNGVDARNSYALGIEYLYSTYAYKFRIYTGSAWVSIYSDYAAKPDQWQHVVATWSSSDKLMRMYVDGTLQSTTQLTTGTSLQSTSSNLIIGRDADGGNKFSGQIDEPRVYDLALSAAQVATNASSKPFYTGNSVYMTNFANGALPKVTFATGYNSYITPSNGTWSTADDFHATSLVVGDGALNASAYNMTLAGDFTQQQNSSTSTFTAPGTTKVMKIGGNFTHASGTFSSPSGTVLFNSKSTDIRNVVLNSGITFNNLTFDSGAPSKGQWKLGAADINLNVSNDFTIGSTVKATADIPPVVIDTPYIWVGTRSSMTGANSVVRRSTTTGQIVGTPVAINASVGSIATSIDKSNNAWVVSNSSQISQLSASTGLTIKTCSTGSQPNNLAIDASGYIWALNFGESTVWKINPDTCAKMNQYAVGINSLGLAVDSDGNVWATSSSLNKVYKINALTNQVSSYDTGNRPAGVAASSDGYIWIANQGAPIAGAGASVSKISQNNPTNKVEILTAAGSRFLAIDASGYVWITNSIANSMSKIDPNTNAKASADIVTGTNPIGMSVSGDGNVWVLSDNGISKYNPSAGTWDNLSPLGAGITPTSLGDMTGYALQRFILNKVAPPAVGLDLQDKKLNAKNVKIAGNDGRITVGSATASTSSPITTKYVWYPDGANGMIKVDTSTNISTPISVLPSGNKLDVKGISVDLDGNAWISFAAVNLSGWNGFQSIKITASNNSIIKITSGGGPALVDSKGFTWLTYDSSTKDVIKYNSSGIEVCRRAIPYSPTAMATDSLGNVWVASLNASTYVASLDKISQDCTIVLSSDPVDHPLGMAVDKDDNLWVVSSLGGYVKKINGATGSSIAIIGTGAYPHGIAIDYLGNVWVANTDGNTISKIDSGTNSVVKTISLTQPAPYGLSISGDGSLWVSHLTVKYFTKIDPISGAQTDKAVSDTVPFVGDFTGYPLQNIQYIINPPSTQSMTTIKASGDWTNTNTLKDTFRDSAGDTSPTWTAELTGGTGTTQKVLGDNIFSTLTINNTSLASRTVTFENGKATVVNGTLNMNGNNKSIIVNSTAPNGKWNITVTKGKAFGKVDSVYISNSQNTKTDLLCASNSDGPQTSEPAGNIRWIISRGATAPYTCNNPVIVTITPLANPRVAPDANFNLKWNVKNATTCTFASEPVNPAWDARSSSTFASLDWSSNVDIRIANTTLFKLTCSNGPDNGYDEITVSINGGICTFNDKNTIQAYVFCENAFNLNGSNSTFNGSVSSKNMSIGDSSANNSFNYGYDVDGAAPPGFKYLNIPSPSEVGNKQ